MQKKTQVTSNKVTKKEESGDSCIGNTVDALSCQEILLTRNLGRIKQFQTRRKSSTFNPKTYIGLHFKAIVKHF